MAENLRSVIFLRPYLRQGLIILFSLTFSIVLLGAGLFAWKGPVLAKQMALASLKGNLAPLGIDQIEIEKVRVGWWRVYLTDVRAKSNMSGPELNIQEVDIALSLFFNVKAIDIIGGTLEIKEGNQSTKTTENWQKKLTDFVKHSFDYSRLKLPIIGLRDCLVIFPASNNVIKIPVHMATEFTVTRNQVLTVDWGEQEDNTLSGQFVLEMGRDGITVDLHATNIDFQTSSFQIQAPEISFWGTNASEESSGYKIDGFAKLNLLKIASYGTLKSPLEVNLEGAGTADDFELDELTISTNGKEQNLLEIEGKFIPNKSSGEMTMTTQISEISRLWDFTPMLAVHADDKVKVEGKLNLAAEISIEEGRLKTSALALDVKGLNVARQGLSLEGGATKFILSTLSPLTTQGVQKMSATRVMANGLDFKNVSLEMLFDKEGRLQINQCTGETLSGSLKAHHFKRIGNTGRPAFQFEADFDNIELADIMKLTDLSRLSGQGRLAGNASMQYIPDQGLDVLQAELHSISDSGLIQYKAEEDQGAVPAMDNGHVNMAFQVLDNLHFSVFSVRIERSPNNPSEMQGIVKMLGSNPNVLNGYPFEFNIVTTGKLKDLVINTLQHMGPTTELKDLNKAIKETKAAKAAKVEQSNAGVSKEIKVKKRKISSVKKATNTRKRKLQVVKVAKYVKQKNRKLKHG